jgi:hypothetical protein
MRVILDGRVALGTRHVRSTSKRRGQGAIARAGSDMGYWRSLTDSALCNFESLKIDFRTMNQGSLF